MKRAGFLCAALSALACSAPLPARAEAPAWPPWVDLSRGVDVDEGYRAWFHLCEAASRARAARLFTYGHGCRDDPNRVTALRRMPGGAVAYVSRLAVDFDGSPLACGPDHDASDQCVTSLMLPDASGKPIPVNADRVPYVVIPRRDPDRTRGQFSRLTGVRVGDFGVVLWRDRVVPVIVADTGPYEKLGEGSLALHRALGHDQCAERDPADTCVRAAEQDSIERDVVTVLFPGSAMTGVTAETLEQTVRAEAMRLWSAYRAELLPAP